MPRAGTIDLPTRQRLRRHLKAAMEERRLTAAEVARRCKMSPSTISTILSGGREIGFDIFIKLHRGLPLSADYMLDEEPRPQIGPHPLPPPQPSPASNREAGATRAQRAARS